MDVVWIILLALTCTAACVLTVLQWPGTWLIVLAALPYAVFSDWQRLSLRWLLVLVAIAVLAELAEALVGVILARHTGASRRAAWYGLAGGMAGALLLSLPVPVFGTLAGAVLGCFAGALFAELQEGRTLREGTRSGAYSAVGRALGSVLKLVATMAMSVILLSCAAMNLLT